jgi:hypothetical protein
MSTFYTYNSWVETFKPIENKISKYNNGHDLMLTFETYDEEYEFVKAQDPNKIWTEVDGDEGTYIIAGHHWVNRIHYYITENPWTDEWTEVPTWCYRICDCSDNEENGYEYDENCPECDEGNIDIPIDTVEDLKVIYGDDANVIS